MARTLRYLLCGILALAAGSNAVPAARGSTRAAPAAEPSTSATTYEAEDAILSGTTVDTAQEGYTGSGYVTGFDEASDKITFEVESEATKLYDLSIRIAAIYGDKHTTVVLNGGASSDVSFPAGDTWVDVPAGQVLLNEGANTIEIVSNWGWYLVDSITLTPSAPRPEHQINRSLNNPSADASARALYDYLRSIYGKKILAGQQDLTWADYVTQQTGKTPALVSVDLMDYSPSRVERGTKGTSVEEAITHAERGGIVSALWHWNAPAGLYDTDEHPWWSGFYTDATDFDVAAALSSTDNANYTLLLRDIDAIAVQLKRLRDARVPVLWRPLHEAEGGWFWWGAKGPDPAKQLYALLYDRLVNHHGINNLIWVWNSLSPDWYPGDDTVDILSADVYAQGNGPMSTQYNQLIDLGKDKKMIAAAEVGAAPLPDLLQAYEAHWLWFAVWGDTFINNAEWNSPEVLKTVYTSDYVLTLDEIQGWQDS
ncbi:glycoside hydrolase family 26 protein [Thermothelomyces thermophilus ATCC 42464]|uniref:Mannan endo-1,4-beta-mannosidase n=1 Tax=Thermothelomyces thermophilus (strain ATCC 42464 / BCRC 31852 / DSM 1799) TaxID=573729 RepID=MA26A_THET4|nr:glycoside hydrolase family 26 protein [Thermothelomyces thermophilus ATCC 42464]G2Q4H7.1 RecName: Full=Mannan endo-1,4-beta-mannosidase; AltName: Full=Endo-(1,4)-beta-mannanase; AltName: Full=GH26 family endo-beta-mannanase; Flags: Precursor [Thermothelomyces thermophilus ATCC 42464]AEO53670.1 glycoside hydrolase family 26 protein [Thermothelomyces thermophilus ATCC 42464]